MARYYANDDERGRLIAGFRALPDFSKIIQTCQLRAGQT